jgi:hypothetical protein
MPLKAAARSSGLQLACMSWRHPYRTISPNNDRLAPASSLADSVS